MELKIGLRYADCRVRSELRMYVSVLLAEYGFNWMEKRQERMIFTLAFILY